MNHPSITHDSPSIVLHAAAHTLTALAALTPHGPRDVGSTAQVRFVDLIKEASASTSVKPDDPFSDITCNGVPLAKFKKCVSGAAAVWWCVCVGGGGLLVIAGSSGHSSVSFFPPSMRCFVANGSRGRGLVC